MIRAADIEVQIDAPKKVNLDEVIICGFKAKEVAPKSPRPEPTTDPESDEDGEDSQDSGGGVRFWSPGDASKPQDRIEELRKDFFNDASWAPIFHRHQPVPMPAPEVALQERCCALNSILCCGSVSGRELVSDEMSVPCGAALPDDCKKHESCMDMFKEDQCHDASTDGVPQTDDQKVFAVNRLSPRKPEIHVEQLRKDLLNPLPTYMDSYSLHLDLDVAHKPETRGNEQHRDSMNSILQSGFADASRNAVKPAVLGSKAREQAIAPRQNDIPKQHPTPSHLHRVTDFLEHWFRGDVLLDELDEAIRLVENGGSEDLRADTKDDSVSGSSTALSNAGLLVDDSKGSRLPYFILSQSCIALVLQIGLAVLSGMGSRAELSSSLRRWTELSVHRDCYDQRLQIWRWWSYQMLHVDWEHTLSNVLLNLIFGIPLEGSYGSLLTFGIYNLGVLSAACANNLIDIHSSMVGMSGGCYTLFGMHISDLILRWHAKKRYRCAHMILLFLFAALDVTFVLVLKQRRALSHGAHMGGLCCGFLVGAVVCTRRDARLRLALIIAASSLGFTLLGVSLAWVFAQWPPQSLGEDAPWCWLRQVQSEGSFGDLQWYCVRCSTQACIETWSSQGIIKDVVEGACASKTTSQCYWEGHQDAC
eukprot:TRINITY_DN59430_c0_g1_i1.p1 TRINITY_DN59430_c0_g1~~TRINITY_DN59430_c0_g1_i1.p1  ORF type:complete len:647 (-),score=74.51 TRINITY_DN59430_c0_g1_i1:142-2082(-)